MCVNIDTGLFEDAAETALYDAVKAAAGDVDAFISQGSYNKALTAIAGLRPVVDTFFDDVMVMAEDDAIRRNRLALLASISAIFGQIADFSQIST